MRLSLTPAPRRGAGRRGPATRAKVLVAALAMGLSTLATVLPVSTARAIPHPSGVGPYNHVLLFGNNGGHPATDPSGPLGYLDAALTAAGFHVRATVKLPTDLSPYGQVWSVGAPTAPTADAEARLVAFARAGGSLMLSGEAPSCCSAVDASVVRVVDQLVALPTGHLKLGPEVWPLKDAPVNAGAIRGVATTPHTLTSFHFSLAGTVDTRGLQRRNVVSSLPDQPRYALIMAWDGTDLVAGGGGRVVLVMDTSWAVRESADPVSAPALAANLATFLKVPGGAS